MALASAFAPVSDHVPGPGAKDSTTLTKFGIGGASAKSGRATAKSGRAIVKSGCAPVTTPVPVFGYDGVPFYTGLVSVGRGVFAMQDCHGFWVHVRPIVVDIYKDDEGEGEGDDEVEPVVPIAPLVNVRAPSAKIVDARGITRVAVTCRGADDCDNGHCTFAHPSEGDQRAMFCPDPKCPTQVRLRANKVRLRTYYPWCGARVCNHAHWVV